jgi:hypothetical protein
MSSLLVFNRVSRLEIQSVMLVFSTRIECVREGESGVIGGKGASDRLNACRKVPLQVNFFR